MSHKAQSVFPTLDAFARWTERNCKNCRHHDDPSNPTPTDRPCKLPDQAYRAYVNDTLLSTEHMTTIFGKLYTSAPTQCGIAPPRCRNRTDKRGRPKHLISLD